MSPSNSDNLSQASVNDVIKSANDSRLAVSTAETRFSALLEKVAADSLVEGNLEYAAEPSMIKYPLNSLIPSMLALRQDILRIDSLGAAVSRFATLVIRQANSAAREDTIQELASKYAHGSPMIILTDVLAPYEGAVKQASLNGDSLRSIATTISSLEKHFELSADSIDDSNFVIK